MLAKVLSGTTIGLDGVLIEVEVDVAGRGFPSFTIVGLPNKAIDEAKDRVRTAIANTSFEMPDSRLTINLAPADIPKEGSGFDLPITIGILAASGFIQKESLKKSLFVGELSLQGEVRPVPGILSLALMAKRRGIKVLYIPLSNVKEAALVDGLIIYPLVTLADLVLHLNNEKKLSAYSAIKLSDLQRQYKDEYDFAEIKGQHQAKRAMEIAAAGNHNLHLKGPPGAGKTLLSRTFNSIMPLMDKQEILEVSQIYSIAGLLNRSSIKLERPFRSPHHTTSRIGLVGGGSRPSPGEITLSHRGVLFLDELPEFPRSVLEALRQPMEDGFVTVSRAAGTLIFPCRFLLLAASNPCPCGYLGHPKKSCHCLPGSVLRYRKRLSGPLLDRIDINIDVPPVEEKYLVSMKSAETSETIRQRVEDARLRQKKRFKNLPIKTNAEMKVKDVKDFCHLTSEATDLLKQAISRLSLSARSYFKTIKLAQTVADLSQKETIEAPMIAEVLQYRNNDS